MNCCPSLFIVQPLISKRVKMNTLLIVEDDLNLRDTLVDIFELRGFNVKTAGDGLEAWHSTNQHTFDVIISDVMMPKMDGFELLQKLKEQTNTALIPVIMLTANTLIESKLLGLEYGANDYITKPFEARELVLKVINLIKMRKKLKEFIVNTTPVIDEPSEGDLFMKQLKKHLAGNLENPDMTLDSLAADMFQSKSTLQRKIKKATGKTPNQYIREYRLECAKQMLQQEVGNTSDIAKKVGFRSLAYFSYAFKQYFGINPSRLQTNRG